ncbi:MAG: ferritin family protein [Candidatus Omnitrophota bacterium]
MGLFNAPEVVDIGIEKEKKRRDFYGRVARSFDNKELKDLFTKLRNWEEEHILRFIEIRDSLIGSEATDSYAGELEDYAKALVDDQLYQNVASENFEKNVTSPASAVQYGIGFEKDAILFFNELIPHVPEQNRKIVQQLIEEEKSHIVYLSQLKNKLRK